MQTAKSSLQNFELLSALADGELRHQEWPNLSQSYVQDPAISSSWNTYHLIGETLRAPGNAVQLTDPAFLTRLNQQLAKQSDVGSELRTSASMSYSGLVCASASATPAGDPQELASNDSHFRWKMIAGFSCFVAVCAVAWNLSALTLPATGSQVAQSNVSVGSTSLQQVMVASPQGLVVRDARLEELLAAHKQLGATSAWPVPSGFLRNANFETPQSLGR